MYTKCDCVVIFQVSSAPFSLEHPNQFYLESRKVRGGVDSVKPEQSSKPEIQTGDNNASTKTEFGDLSEKDLEDMDTM